MGTRPDILFLVGSYLPRCSAVGACIRNIAEALVPSSNVSVICVRQTLDEPDSEIIHGQHVIRVSTPLSHMRAWANDAQARQSVQGLAAKRLTQVARVVRLAVRADGIDESLVRAYVSALESLPSAPSIIVAACMPFEAVVAASRYKSMHAHTRVLSVLFDHFSESPTLYPREAMRRFKQERNDAAELDALQGCDLIVSVNWGKRIHSRFPDLEDKTVQGEHPLLRNNASSEANDALAGTLLYAGALYQDIRNPSFALGVIAKTLVSSECLKHAAFFVPNRMSFADQFAHCGAGGKIGIYPAVPTERMPVLCGSASWLLSIGNKNSNQKSSKVYEYLSYGKPIVHIASRRDDQTAQELAAYPLALCLFEDDGVQKGSDALARFLDSTCGQSMRFEEVERRYPQASPQRYVEYIEALLL